MPLGLGSDGPQPLWIGGEGPNPLAVGVQVTVGGRGRLESTSSNRATVEPIRGQTSTNPAATRTSPCTGRIARNDERFIPIGFPYFGDGDYVYAMRTVMGDVVAWGKVKISGKVSTIQFLAGAAEWGAAWVRASSPKTEKVSGTILRLYHPKRFLNLAALTLLLSWQHLDGDFREVCQLVVVGQKNITARLDRGGKMEHASANPSALRRSGSEIAG